MWDEFHCLFVFSSFTCDTVVSQSTRFSTAATSKNYKTDSKPQYCKCYNDNGYYDNGDPKIGVKRKNIKVTRLCNIITKVGQCNKDLNPKLRLT